MPNSFLRVVAKSFETLRGQARDFTGQLGQVRLIKDLMAKPISPEFGGHAAQQPKGSNNFYLDWQAGRFFLSTEFAKKWLRMGNELKLSEPRFNGAVRAFILHEFFHVAQGLTSARHEDARTSPASTGCLDYYADYNAALASFYLSTEVQDDWTKGFADTIADVLYAMAIFQHPLSAQRGLLLLRLKRYFLAHYQYHRVGRFRGSDPTQLQLLFQPTFDIYGLRSGKKISKKMVAEVKPPDGEHYLRLVAPDKDGMPKLCRFTPMRPENTQSRLADGIFCPDLNATLPFFEQLFENHECLVGGRRGDEPSQPLTHHAFPSKD